MPSHSASAQMSSRDISSARITSIIAIAASTGHPGRERSVGRDRVDVPVVTAVPDELGEGVLLAEQVVDQLRRRVAVAGHHLAQPRAGAPRTSASSAASPRRRAGELVLVEEGAPAPRGGQRVGLLGGVHQRDGRQQRRLRVMGENHVDRLHEPVVASCAMATLTHDTRVVAVRRARCGLAFAVLAAASFGLSGGLAAGLLDAGWSPAALVLCRSRSARSPCWSRPCSPCAVGGTCCARTPGSCWRSVWSRCRRPVRLLQRDRPPSGGDRHPDRVRRAGRGGRLALGAAPPDALPADRRPGRPSRSPGCSWCSTSSPSVPSTVSACSGRSAAWSGARSSSWSPRARTTACPRSCSPPVGSSSARSPSGLAGLVGLVDHERRHR